MHGAGLEALKNAVVVQAAMDYRKAALKKGKERKRMLHKVEKFLTGSWFCAFTNLDGTALLEQLERETDEERREHLGNYRKRE